MAEITPSGKSKRRLVRPDMTAMVDVAFLLLMFFVLTAAVASKPKAIDLALPVEGTSDVSCNKVMTVYLAADDKVHYTFGCEAEFKTTDYSPQGLRTQIQWASTQTNDLIVVVKPTDRSRYQNLVDVLDEMRIVKVKKFAVANLTENDFKILDEHLVQYK